MTERKGTLLLVEDDELQRELMAMLLRNAGHEVVEAPDIRSALEASSKGDFDVLLTDYSLPDGRGTELIQREILPHGQIIMISGHGGLRVPDAVTLLRKPVNLDEFWPLLAAKLSRSKSGASSAVYGEMSPSSRGRRVTLCLYVSRDAPTSEAVIADVKRHLHGVPPSDYELVVRDASAATSLPDPVVFTPCLVRQEPLPRMWVLGDMSDPTPIRQLLRKSGLLREEASS